MSITTKGRDAGWKCTFDDYLDLYFYLDKEMFYKKISIVPAYNIQSLIGNAGTQQFFIFIHLCIELVGMTHIMIIINTIILLNRRIHWTFRWIFSCTSSGNCNQICKDNRKTLEIFDQIIFISKLVI